MLTEYWTGELGPKDAPTQKEDTLQAALMIFSFHHSAARFCEYVPLTNRQLQGKKLTPKKCLCMFVACNRRAKYLLV